jgi:translation initiation factor eIF-2B subunit delta
LENEMTDRSRELDSRIARLALDRESGATAILGEAIGILALAIGAGLPVTPIARAICEAQPSMASVWAAAIAAVASGGEPGRFDRFVQRVARSQAAVARFAADLFSADEAGRPLRLVTVSASRSVQTVFEAVRHRRPLHVSCTESRPAREGRTLAATLAASGIAVSVFADAAIAHALSTSDAVVVGADAVGIDWFLNKSGTRMLAAAASQQGVPVYTVATREKFVGPDVASRLVVREGAADEVWESPPPGVEVRNPYFESTPLDLVTLVISDVGVLGTGMVRDVCAATSDDATVEALALITG